MRNRTVCWHFNGYIPVDSFMAFRGQYLLLEDTIEMYVSMSNSNYFSISIHPLLVEKVDYSPDNKKESIIGSKFVFTLDVGVALAKACGFEIHREPCNIGIDIPSVGSSPALNIPCRLGSSAKCASFSLVFADDDSDY